MAINIAPWITMTMGLPDSLRTNLSQGDQAAHPSALNTAGREIAATNDTKGMTATLINASLLHLAKHALAVQCIRHRSTANTLLYLHTTSEPRKK